MPRQLTQKQKEKVKKLLSIIKLGDLALAKLIFDIEDSINTEIPEIKRVLEQVEQKTYKPSKKDIEYIAKRASDLLEKPKIAQQAVKLVDVDDLAQKAAKLVKMPKMPRKVTKVVEKHTVHEQPIITNNTTEVVKEVAVADMAEDIRNKLELLTEEERLDIKAIRGADGLTKDLEFKYKDLNNKLVSLPPAGINRIADDGSIKWTGQGILNLGTGFTVTPTTSGVDVVLDTVAEADTLQSVTDRGATTDVHSTFEDGLTVNANKRVYYDGA